MVNYFMNTTSLRLSLSESLWLEPEHYEQAREQTSHISSLLSDESQRWQAYLNALAQIPFIAWLQEKLPDGVVQPIASESPEFSYLSVCGFRLCLIATEHVLALFNDSRQRK